MKKLLMLSSLIITTLSGCSFHESNNTLVIPTPEFATSDTSLTTDNTFAIVDNSNSLYHYEIKDSGIVIYLNEDKSKYMEVLPLLSSKIDLLESWQRNSKGQTSTIVETEDGWRYFTDEKNVLYATYIADGYSIVVKGCNVTAEEGLQLLTSYLSHEY